jgi:signal transduction histidine kinase
MRGHGLQALVRRSTVAQIALVAVVAGVAAAMFLSYRAEVRRADAVRETLLGLQELRGEVLSAETGLRGYTLTRRPSFLAPYREAFPRIAQQEQRVYALLPEATRPRLKEIQAVVEDWHTGFAETVLSRLRAGRARAAMEVIDAGAGKARIDRVRRLVADLAASERARLVREQDRLALLSTVGLAAIAAAFLLAVLGAMVLRRRLEERVGRPMTALADAARAFGDGDLGQRVSVRGGVGEVEVAADAFDDMAARIEEMVLRLRELDELKSHFVASVSHELRTPLTSVSGFVGVLLEPGGEPLSDGQREMLAIVKRNAGYLEALIDDLLLLARLESGQMTLELRDVDVAELLEELCAELQPAVHERAIALDVEADGRPVVAADRARLRQTFVNLVGNAIKFSPPAGRVAVRALSEGEEAVVEICDEGPGIPEDELPRLCERFFRASTAVGVKGTGLGLTISREIVELHGGRLEVRSTLGEGSTFRVHLPAVAR